MTRRWVGLVLLSMTGCDTTRSDGEKAVRAYNEAAIIAYRTQRFEELAQVATQAEQTRVTALVDLKRANRLVLESELQKVEVKKATRTAEHLTVDTTERWRYFDRPLDPGLSQGQVFVADMELSYDFVREDDRWKLAQAKTVASRYLEPRGFEPGRRELDAGP